MKYVVILIVVVILVRIDIVLKLFDKTTVKYQNRSDEIKPGEIAPSSEIVSISNDLSLKISPRKTFISMLNDFGRSPDISIKNQAIESLRSQPTMFTDKLDTELESSIYQWRDLLLQRNKVTHEFLLELMKYLKGENLEMIKRFFSFVIDIDLGDFLNIYSKSTDTNCLIMGYLGDSLPIEERINELSERLTTLDAFLLIEKPEAIKNYAQHCQIVLKLQVDKLKAVVVSSENAVAIPNAVETSDIPNLSVPAPLIDTGNAP